MRKGLVPLSCLLFISITLAFGQVAPGTSSKTLQVYRTLPNAPIAIVRVLYQGKEVKPGVPFEAGDNWLEHVSVVVKNISSSSDIIYVNITGDLPETGEGTTTSPRVLAMNTVGRRPEAAMVSPRTGRRYPQIPGEPITLEPDQELTMSLLGKSYVEDFRSFITAKQPLSTVTQCSISVASVYFADGTKWSHFYSEPDTTTPGRYKSISFDEWQEKQRTP
jgi:hypothetical protein